MVGFALRQLRAHGKKAGTEKKLWAITTISSQEREADDVFESEESLEIDENFSDFGSGIYSRDDVIDLLVSSS